MLTVIFGAGASYDSVPARPPGHTSPYRPPLANELFGDRELFALHISRLERLQPIIPWLRHIHGRNVESVLREFEDQADSYPERRSQIMAVRYYLECMLSECEQKWEQESKGVTNYKSLLDEIARFRRADDNVCLITFDYDTLLDHALEAIRGPIGTLADYVSDHSPYKLFKLHGSTTWARTVEPLIYRDRNAMAVARQHIELATTLRVSDSFVINHEHPCGAIPDGVGLVPAIAVPVEKKSTFECPKSHLAILEKMLPETDRLLLVGWRGTEDHFLKLLENRLRGNVSTYIIAEHEPEARNVADPP